MMSLPVASALVLVSSGIFLATRNCSSTQKPRADYQMASRKTYSSSKKSTTYYGFIY